MSCVPDNSNVNLKKPFTSKGFAYIYEDEDFLNKVISKKLDNDSMQIAHNKLRPGTLIKLINAKNNESIVLKVNKRFEYPDFYKILITKPVAEELGLEIKLPFVEVLEVKKNKSFVVEKTKIFNEEKKTHSNAPVELVKIDNISKNNKNLIKKKEKKDKFYIIIATFYSKKSAALLKKRISNEIVDFKSKKLFIMSKKTNKITLLSGPYSSINSMKNDYIQLKKFGIEELDISLNE
jgi:rare lipoprotein A (peptidoglycan hydrolase)